MAYINSNFFSSAFIVYVHCDICQNKDQVLEQALISDVELLKHACKWNNVVKGALALKTVKFVFKLNCLFSKKMLVLWCF